MIPRNEAWYVVDVEADGPAPGLFSLVSVGAVLLTPDLSRTFFGETRPLPGAKSVPEALAISGVSLEQHAGYPDPHDTFAAFERWIETTRANRKPVFWSDNNGFDWQFVNYYFHLTRGHNPFGHSSRRIGDYAAGLRRSNWRKLRRTAHTHHPVDDAKGNAEALLVLLNS